MSHALVTGASRGIGRAIAELLLARGRSVIASARDGALLASLEQAHPGRVTTIPCDLAQPGAAAKLIERAREVGTLHEVVLAAGIARYAAFADVTEQDLRAQLELNFIAPFTLLQHAGRSMAEGSMVVVASTLAFRTAPTTAAYAASKAALVSAARSAALELAPRVRVNVVAPGVVDTDMVRAPRRALSRGEDAAALVAQQLASLRALHPLGRLGTPEEVAEAVLYLLDARWLTGTVLTIDGGLTVS